MFRTLLIANRGEIACRVIRTAQRMGLRTVAVYSEADQDALHVKLADAAVCIGPARASDSYLSIETILAAARQTGAEAIHPGYGFLSENEDFAAACERAGIVFVGPSAAAIAAMGDKAAAKALMEKADVPLVPGYHGENQDPDFLLARASEAGFPVLLKPAAGGGGKGMRVVRAAGEFKTALAGAKREAASSFGDDRILIERFLERSRHIEVQVFGDTQGTVVHLFERDCSVQRRYQKVFEEAPAPGLGAAQREAMTRAAVSAAQAIGYTGAGTVEFIAETSAERPGELTGRFYFMEMNTRLQVEHPVTEMITGVDLVEWQLRVAAGEPLPLAQSEIRQHGHAIEARLYAERAEREFMPSTGRLAALALPSGVDGLRVDTGVETGSEITSWYDPMIAKLIAHGADRDEALARLARALPDVFVAGVHSNVAFLGRIAGSTAFRAAALDTTLIERERAAIFPAPAAPGIEVLAAAAWATLRDEAEAHPAAGDPHSPWNVPDGWRMNQDAEHEFEFLDKDAEDAPCTLRLVFADGGTFLLVDGARRALSGTALPDGCLALRLGERSFKARVAREGRLLYVLASGASRRLALKDDLEAVDAVAGNGSLAAPLPGKLVVVMVSAGDTVARGDPLLVIEAMKMEHTLSAPRDGRIAEVFFRTGDAVAEGSQLLRLEEEPTGDKADLG
jgi:3-methylcrotonyl-CoA carboxylase alpha subunit